MGKKRPFELEKRAQITIFMILGFLLLLIFVFLMQVASHATKSQFSREQEKVFTKAFQKESLRLFVDDCLRDELEKGLILLGKQGTLWADQPGGIKQFSESHNGLTYSTTENVGEFHSGRIAYGIIDEHYPEFPPAYPCDSELNSPIFCQYRHPNTAVGFGTAKLFTSTFSSDLKQFLLERTAWCVENFIHTDVSGAAEIIPTDIELELSIDEQGINAKVNYPLKFKVGGEEIFSLSTFDFFYPSRFKQLLDVASFALAQDKNLVDFNLTPEKFTRPIFTYSSELQVGPCVPYSNYFLCERSLPLDTYQSLGLALSKESPPAFNGDDIFTFTPALYEIVDNPEPYSLRIARQNRPPALDYVQRAACPTEGYDYLVIKGDERYGYGDLNLIPHAIDPDEDRFSIDFNSELGTPAGEILYLPAESVEAILNNLYTVKVTATDDHGKKDSQDVRVLVDRPIHVGLELAFPESYNINSYIGGGGDTTPLYVVSREDPILLHATIPAGTETSNLQTIVLNYADGSGVADVGRGIGRLEYGSAGISTEQCYNFPLRQEGEASTCVSGQPYDLNYYNSDEKINHLNDFNYYTFQPFQQITDPAAPGTLSLNFNTNYCGVAIPEQRSEIKVQVASCVPVRNPEHPFAYPYEKYKFGTITNEAGKIVTDFHNFISDSDSINPLASTHSCCVGDPAPALASGWRVAEKGRICFTDPRPDCYGEIDGLTSLSSNQGYVWEIKKRACDGVRGNVCSRENVVSELYGRKLWCGETSLRCNRVATDCGDSAAFGYIDRNHDGTNDGWCHGRMGCGAVCSGDAGVSYIGSLADTGPVPNFRSEEINRKATALAQEQGVGGTDFENTLSFPFRCGCSDQPDVTPDGTPCDKNYDGRFTDVCDGGHCVGLACGSGSKTCVDDTSWHQCNELGTEYGSATRCPSGQFCVGNGECRAPICTPFAQWCFTGFVNWLSDVNPQAAQRMESASAEQQRAAFLCDEHGLDIEDVACSPACNSNTVLVEVNPGGEGNDWECRPCGNNDWQAPNQKRCVKGRVQGMCARVSSGGNIHYECSN